MAQYVYGICSPQDTLTPVGILTEFHITTSGTEQELPGQCSTDQVADTGTSNVKTTVDMTIRGSSIPQDTIKTLVGQVKHVSISSEDTPAATRHQESYSFDIKITNADVTAKSQDWWDVKITGTVQWNT